MILTGFFQKIKDGELHTYRNVRFESTGVVDNLYNDGKVIWRKLNKDGTPSNVFAEQFVPDVPWAAGKWFVRINSASVLTKYPQLKVETERSKQMTDEEYIAFLDSTFEQY